MTYIATIAFGLIRVITAVFLRDTLDAAAMDAEEQVGDFFWRPPTVYLNSNHWKLQLEALVFLEEGETCQRFYADLCLIKSFHF